MGMASVEQIQSQHRTRDAAADDGRDPGGGGGLGLAAFGTTGCPLARRMAFSLRSTYLFGKGKISCKLHSNFDGVGSVRVLSVVVGDRVS